ncbi:MAG: hypothetical protein WBF39_05680 [Planococcus donghaensis]
MWDRFYDNSLNHFAKGSSQNTKLYEGKSFDSIEAIIEVAWERPEMKNRLIKLFEEKLKNSKLKCD